VRVIAGALGGRRLAAPRGRDTRPTSDRVREALFMSLEPLAGMRVVDLFAGSGALGIEALSRGAAHVDFVERERAARAVLEANLTNLGLTGCATVWGLELPRGFARLGPALAGAQLVLADPPYGGALARATLQRLAHAPLAAGARVVIEHHAKDALPEREGALARERQRAYGETVVSTWRVTEPAA
jgi:16S rRNA (guanine966-N2)-methyltransferase